MEARTLLTNVRSEVDIRHGKALRHVWLSIADYAFNVVLMLLFAWTGAVPYSVPVVVLAYAVTANAVYLGLIYSGFSLRFKDPYLTRFGIALALCANFLGLAIAPQIAILFIANLFIPLGFAALRFTNAQFRMAGIFCSIVLGSMFASGLLATPSQPLGPQSEFILWMAISIVFLRFLIIQTEIANLGNKLREKNAALNAATEKLALQAGSDELTGLINRREFMRVLGSELNRSSHSAIPFCVALLDIDHFKQINDRYGHAVGDIVLSTAARIFRQSVRASDMCARYGGEEFTILITTSDFEGAAKMLDRLRENLENHDWDTIGPKMRVTVSVGLTIWAPGDNETEILRRADSAMYRAKHQGRNRVIRSPDKR